MEAGSFLSPSLVCEVSHEQHIDWVRRFARIVDAVKRSRNADSFFTGGSLTGDAGIGLFQAVNFIVL